MSAAEMKMLSEVRRISESALVARPTRTIASAIIRTVSMTLRHFRS
jgi:hypothetical protein